MDSQFNVVVDLVRHSVIGDVHANDGFVFDSELSEAVTLDLSLGKFCS